MNTLLRISTFLFYRKNLSFGLFLLHGSYQAADSFSCSFWSTGPGRCNTTPTRFQHTSRVLTLTRGRRAKRRLTSPTIPAKWSWIGRHRQPPSVPTPRCRVPRESSRAEGLEGRRWWDPALLAILRQLSGCIHVKSAAVFSSFFFIYKVTGCCFGVG